LGNLTKAVGRLTRRLNAGFFLNSVQFLSKLVFCYGRDHLFARLASTKNTSRNEALWEARTAVFDSGHIGKCLSRETSSAVYMCHYKSVGLRDVGAGKFPIREEHRV
jgi:hypothetical protein